jgi:SAM-dependent methyltransferase
MRTDRSHNISHPVAAQRERWYRSACCACATAILVMLPPAIAARAAEQFAIRLDQERARQDAIYQSRGAQIPDGYVVDRSLLSYVHTLSPAFDAALAKLGPQERWLDIGAGSGQAVLDYFLPRFDRMHRDGREQPERRARAVAISIEDRRTLAWQQAADALGANRLQYRAGKRLREYSPGELGRFELITDVVGGFSYTSDLALFMRKVLELLQENGDFFTVLTDVRSESGGNKPYFADNRFLTEIRNPDGSASNVCAWLKRIACVEVICRHKPDWQPPVETFHVRKVCQRIEVPALLPLQFEAGTPPERTFQREN